MEIWKNLRKQFYQFYQKICSHPIFFISSPQRYRLLPHLLSHTEHVQNEMQNLSHKISYWKEELLLPVNGIPASTLDTHTSALSHTHTPSYQSYQCGVSTKLGTKRPRSRSSPPTY